MYAIINVNGEDNELTRSLALDLAVSYAINAHTNLNSIAGPNDLLAVQAMSAAAQAQAALSQAFSLLHDRIK